MVQNFLLITDQNFEVPHRIVTKIAKGIECHRVNASRVWSYLKKELFES